MLCQHYDELESVAQILNARSTIWELKAANAAAVRIAPIFGTILPHPSTSESSAGSAVSGMHRARKLD